MSKPDHISEIYDEENGVSVILFQHRRGFAVNVFDIDAEEFVGIISIFPTLERAEDYALKCIL